MRPVNLIPPEERRGEHAPMRTGPLAYILVGALVVVLAGVTALVLDRQPDLRTQGEVAQLEARRRAADGRGEAPRRLHPVPRRCSEQRVATVTSLADSRFDWERVMRELSLVLPSDVWLVDLTASASAGVAGGESQAADGRGGLRGAIARAGAGIERLRRRARRRSPASSPRSRTSTA